MRKDKFKPSQLKFGFAVVRVGCTCGQHVIRKNGRGEIVCGRCGMRFSYMPDSEVYDDRDDLVLDCVYNTPSIMEYIDSHISHGPPADGAEADGSEDDAQEPEGDLSRRVSELEAELQSVREQRDSEVSRLLSKNKAMKDLVNRLRDELEDVDQTRRMLAKELSTVRSVDVPGIVGDFLECVTGISNTIADTDSLETIREISAVRIERLGVSLRGHGAELRRHGRGDDLGDGRMDIIPVETDDPALDMRVQRSSRYGCVFENGVYAEIPEELSVYRYRKPEPPAEEAEASEVTAGEPQETRLREVETL